MLELHGVSARFGDTPVLKTIDLAVADGETISVLGPSGAGKTTLLRLIAGLERPTEGRILWVGADLAGVPVHERGFGLMFQDYALFPHRTVGANVAFGLRMNGWAPDRIRARVEEMLVMVGLKGLADRHIQGLSGGEQQRVALARTLAPSPRLVMLDEPLGSLDRELRDRLATESRTLFTTLGVTAIYVTHDREEAFAMADRVAIMRGGQVVSVGSPQQLWEDPGSAFVARLLGHPNIVDPAQLATLGVAHPRSGGPVLIPASAVTIGDDPGGSGKVTASVFRGGHWDVTVTVDGVDLVGATSSPLALGAAASIRVEPAALVALES